jgi:hypothetical protein
VKVAHGGATCARTGAYGRDILEGGGATGLFATSSTGCAMYYNTDKPRYQSRFLGLTGTSAGSGAGSSMILATDTGAGDQFIAVTTMNLTDDLVSLIARTSDSALPTYYKTMFASVDASSTPICFAFDVSGTSVTTQYALDVNCQTWYDVESSPGVPLSITLPGLGSTWEVGYFSTGYHASNTKKGTYKNFSLKDE